ncbi:MAG: RNB domain-containing ribonuclease [Buchananella hordeovulneris]|nr:RNB domain-containing ribonuclease [Buchananella hordeovulneris]
MTLHRLFPGTASSQRVRQALDELRREHQVPVGFPPEVASEAAAVAAAWENLDWPAPSSVPSFASGPAPSPASGAAPSPDPHPAPRLEPVSALPHGALPLDPSAVAAARSALPGRVPALDMRHVPLVTIDPPQSRDLDQAVHIEQRARGFVIHYAIASLATFVTPGGALDQEVRSRATTIYAPDYATPLHPSEVSESAASLLPGVDRPAYMWRFELNERGEVDATALTHALVRSRAQLSYAQVQEAVEGRATLPAAPDLPALLKAVGILLRARELERGGISLRTPAQEVEKVPGGYHLTYAATLPVEEWNAQISLLTGMEAARLMRAAGVGILRTLPPPGEAEIERLRIAARALGLQWPREMGYPEFVRGLSSTDPAEAAFLAATPALFRGAGYLPFGGPCAPLPGDDVAALTHGSIAAPYAHVTAPLRRLVDRFGLEICLAQANGHPVPSWVLEALPELPQQMATGGRKARALDAGAVAALEALVLAGQEGNEFPAVLLDAGREGNFATAMLREPAVIIPVSGTELRAASEVRVRIVAVDVPARSVQAQVV